MKRMSERQKMIAYLEHVASLWPSDGFRERHNLSPEMIGLGRAIIRTCAEQIRKGQHLRYVEKEMGK